MSPKTKIITTLALCSLLALLPVAKADPVQVEGIVVTPMTVNDQYYLGVTLNITCNVSYDPLSYILTYTNISWIDGAGVDDTDNMAYPMDDTAYDWYYEITLDELGTWTFNITSIDDSEPYNYNYSGEFTFEVIAYPTPTQELLDTLVGMIPVVVIFGVVILVAAGFGVSKMGKGKE